MADPNTVWEDVYAQSTGRHFNRYPSDSVIPFILRAVRASKTPVRVVELGFGAGQNLWFAAREGAEVAGVEISPTAAGFARNRLAQEGLRGDLRTGSFTSLPFADQSFDLAINRGAICCVPKAEGLQAVAEARRVLRPQGRFLYTGYSDRSWVPGRLDPDGAYRDITDGYFAAVGQFCVHSLGEMNAMFGAAAGWRLVQLRHVETALVTPQGLTVMMGEWVAEAERLP